MVNKFKANNVIYWTHHEQPKRVIGVGIIGRDGLTTHNFSHLIPFAAWLFTDDEYQKDFGYGWFSGNDDSGIQPEFVHLHPDPDLIWASYCAAKLTGEIRNA